ncbi:hypothetical protein VTI74DRAFT_1772 [Chaetomium olivicolor]
MLPQWLCARLHQWDWLSATLVRHRAHDGATTLLVIAGVDSLCIGLGISAACPQAQTFWQPDNHRRSGFRIERAAAQRHAGLELVGLRGCAEDIPGREQTCFVNWSNNAEENATSSGPRTLEAPLRPWHEIMGRQGTCFFSLSRHRTPAVLPTFSNEAWRIHDGIVEEQHEAGIRSAPGECRVCCI